MNIFFFLSINAEKQLFNLCINKKDVLVLRIIRYTLLLRQNNGDGCIEF